LTYYFLPVIIIALTGVVFLISMFFTRESIEALNRVDYHTNESINSSKSEGREHLLKDETPAPIDKPGHIVKHIWSPLISIFVTIFTVVATVTLIAAVPSATHNPKLPVYILYVGSLCGFAGSELAVFFKWTATPRGLFAFSMVRTLIMPFILFYSVKQFWLNDTFILAVLAVFAASGNFCISKCYSVCAASVSLRQQAAASNWLNISLYVGIYFGLAFPYVLPHIITLPS